MSISPTLSKFAAAQVHVGKLNYPQASLKADIIIKMRAFSKQTFTARLGKLHRNPWTYTVQRPEELNTYLFTHIGILLV